MEDLLEISKYILPSVVVFGTAYYLIKMMLQNEMTKKRFDLALANKKVTTPMRLHAFERLTLFLERISFNSLLIRSMRANMNVQQLQVALLSNIRQEYEHNMSQQIYVSDNSWEAIRMAKENSIKIINTVTDSLQKDAPAIELSKKIMGVIMQNENSPTDLAIKILKNEIRSIL